MIEQKNKILIALICVFFISLGLTIAVGFSNQQEPRMLIKSVIPAYDEESTVVVSDNGVVFNDKNQEVKYKVVIENPNNYDVKVSDIVLSTPTEEFLEYEVENLNKDDVIKENGTKELVVSFNTVKKEGWGRNFTDDLTANVIFAKVTKLEEPKPTPKPEELKEEVKEEEKKEPVVEEEHKEDIAAPVIDSEEVKQNFTLIETFEIEEDEIVFNKIENVVDKQKIDVWIYSEPIYLGRFEVEVKDGKTKILGLSEALEKHGIEEGNHSLVMQTETGEKIGYVEVKINNQKIEKPLQEELVPEEDISNNVEDVITIDKEEKEESNKDNKVLLVVLITLTAVTGTAIVVILVVNKKKKIVATIVVLLSGISLVKADVLIELPITFNVSFESQNVMKTRNLELDGADILYFGADYWAYSLQIVSFNISNEIEEINQYDHEFDVSEAQNGRVKAYLVKNEDYSTCVDLNNEEAPCYDLYLQADGLIYSNLDSSYYFGYMFNLNEINNLEGLDVSNVRNMEGMFLFSGNESLSFSLDLGDNFDTSNVTNMTNMFNQAGTNNISFTLDLGDKFDTSKVINMRGMFNCTGYVSTIFTLDLGDKFDTSNVTDMGDMFAAVGHNNTNLTLDLGDKFDTSNVTDMGGMFSSVGYNSIDITLDLGDKFDTSNVTDMSFMFSAIGYSKANFILDLGDKFDTSKVVDMGYMFSKTGYGSTNFTLDLGDNFDTSNVKDMENMFSLTGYSSTVFTLDLGDKFDTANLTEMKNMFNGTGYSSTKFNIEFTIKKKSYNYLYMFKDVATKEGSQIVVNYTKANSSSIDTYIRTKSTNSNVVKGVCIDCN